MPKEVRKARYFSRREELQDPELLSALISRRDYYTDAWWMIAVAVTPDAPYSLEQLHEALRFPGISAVSGTQKSSTGAAVNAAAA